VVTTPAGVTVAERLRLRLADLTHAERKVARVLMADYPVRGLDPVARLLAARADVILTSSVQSPSPFDALTPAVALVEAIIAALVDRLGDAPRARMARYDALTGGSVDGQAGRSTGTEAPR
jgi:DNA-binding MurR/RpiR family transcriptional regulator